MKTIKLSLATLLISFISCNQEDTMEIQDETITKNANKTSINTLSNEEILLWNNGVSKRSWLFLNQDSAKTYKNASCFWDADLVGNPINAVSNTNEYSFNDGITNEVFTVPSMRCPSLKWVTLGYKYNDWGKYSGYDMWIFDSNTNGSPQSYIDPIEFTIMNHARGMNDEINTITSARKLREVGFVFDNWAQYWPNDAVNHWTGGIHSFKDNYKVNQFSDIKLTFNAKMEVYRKPYSYNDTDPQNYKLGGYVTSDFRFNLYDNSGNLIKSFLIGIIFSNPQNIDYNSNIADNIIYENDTPSLHSILLDGRKLGITCIDNNSDKDINLSNVNETYYINQFKTISINYFSLIQQYNFDNTIITGLDIYSATRGSVITYSIKNIQLKGLY